MLDDMPLDEQVNEMVDHNLFLRDIIFVDGGLIDSIKPSMFASNGTNMMVYPLFATPSYSEALDVIIVEFMLTGIFHGHSTEYVQHFIEDYAHNVLRHNLDFDPTIFKQYMKSMEEVLDVVLKPYVQNLYPVKNERVLDTINTLDNFYTLSLARYDSEDNKSSVILRLDVYRRRTFTHEYIENFEKSIYRQASIRGCGPIGS